MCSSALRFAKPALLLSLALTVSEATTTDETCREARQVLDDLADGSIGDVWEIVESGDLPDFDAIGDVDDETFAACRDLVVSKLKKVLSRADDDRVVARILDEIDFEDVPALVPVLREALRHESPDVRHHALRAVTRAQDPSLAPEVEARFGLELDDRVRRELIRALAASDSRRFLAELRHLALSDDARLAHVALHAVTDLPDPASIRFLADIASSSSGEDLEPARIASALSEWNDVPGVDEALLRIGRDGPEQAVPVAIAGLAQRGPNAVDALAAIANARARAGETVLAELAETTIQSIQDYGGEETNSVTIACGGAGGRGRNLPLASGDGDEFLDSRFMNVATADGSESARCWDAPGFMWPGEIRPRLAAGAALHIFDEFSWGGERWLASYSVDDSCWMREADLAVRAGPREAENHVAAYEFDLAIADVHSWAVGNLERRGWLRSLSTDGPVVTLRLAIEMPARDTVAALIDLRHRTDASGVIAAIDQWLWRHASAWSGDEELGGAIPKQNPR